MIKEAEEQEQQVQQNEPPKNCENQNSVMRNVENQEVNLLSKEELCKRIEGVEKELKSRFAMEEFSGATATSIIQEFYINMLLSNLVSLIKNDADEEIDITSKSSNKFRYQANRAFIIGRIKIIFPKILCDLSELPVIEKLYKEAVRCRSQILPGRSFPRKKLKSKGRSHFRNKKAAL